MEDHPSARTETPLKQSKRRGPKVRPDSPPPKPKKMRWKAKQPPYQVGKDDFNYWDIPDCLKLISPKDFLPLSFDLVRLHTSQGREVIGWWTGGSWFKRRGVSDEVIHWRRELYVH